MTKTLVFGTGVLALSSMVSSLPAVWLGVEGNHG
jgi:hypothetical protein